MPVSIVQTAAHLIVFEALEKVFHLILDEEGKAPPTIFRSHSSYNTPPPYMVIQTPHREQIGFPTRMPITDSEAVSQDIVVDYEANVMLREVGDADFLGLLADRMYDADVIAFMEEYGVGVNSVGRIDDFPVRRDSGGFIYERICDLGVSFATMHQKLWNSAVEKAVAEGVTLQGSISGEPEGSPVHLINTTINGSEE